MAYTKKLKLLDYDPRSVRSIPAASAAVIEPGMIVKYSANEVTQISSVNDNTTVIGVANGKSASGETDPIPIITKGIFRATVVEATYQYGAGLKYDASANDGSLVADSDADTIIWAWGYGATVTSLKVYFDFKLLDAKLWDTCGA